MKRYLAESEDYRVISEYEIVYLEFKKESRSNVVIGDFYGDPQCAMISSCEQYVVLAGCGFIVYSLQEPFNSYHYSTGDNVQYFERFRYEPNLKWIDSVYQVGVDIESKYFRYIVEEENGSALYKFDCDSKKVEALRVITHNEE